MDNVAWDYLSPIQRAQLLHCRRDIKALKEMMPDWKTCEDIRNELS